MTPIFKALKWCVERSYAMIGSEPIVIWNFEKFDNFDQHLPKAVIFIEIWDITRFHICLDLETEVV